MKIDGLLTTMGTSVSRGTGARPTAGQDFAAMMTAASSSKPPSVSSSSGGDGVSVDFTSMTRKELFDWMNDRIRSGQLSLDDSTGFLGMASQMAVDAGSGIEQQPDDRQLVDFFQDAKNRIAGALSFGDKASADRLTDTLAIMRSYQRGVTMGARQP